MSTTSCLELGHSLSLHDFEEVVYHNRMVSLSDAACVRTAQTRRFINYLLEKRVGAYGITTGFADLRDCSVSAEESGQLSINLIRSHDAGIGKPLPYDVVLGAMVIRAQSLSKGHSGFKVESLHTLLEMINKRVMPEIPCTGSLGASGDLAYFARLGMAMMGEEVPVYYDGQKMSAKHALHKAGITPFMPGAKEGLALTNGTSFMASMIAIGYLKQWRIWENMFALQGLFLNSVGAMSAAFSGSIQEVRGQRGQKIIAEQLLYMVEGSSFQEKNSVQNDYCIRCLPQIFGPKLDLFIDQYPIVCRELNAVTDNPLIFKDEEISRDVEKPVSFEGSQWAILSGGNFHGEYLTSVADCLAMANAKIALTLERQMTYVLNPARNRGKLPVYLITETAKSGLLSGYMIPQYSANALAQKICQLGIPAAIFNITSANESEDIVSYGATAGQRWLEQLTLMEELLAIYGTVMAQAYSIARLGCQKMGGISEEIFNLIGEGYPTAGDDPFAARYAAMGDLLASNILRKRVAFPLKDCLN